MTPTPLRFRPLAFSLLVLAAVVLVANWIMPIGRAWWDEIDLSAFNALNGTLSNDPEAAWNHFWALMNLRWTDLATGLLMAGILLWPGAVFPSGQKIRGLTGFVLLLILMLLIRELFDEMVALLDINRPSPSLTVDTAIRLTELYPDMGTKDESARSFPGDHASVLLLWVGYCLAQRRNLWSIAVLLLGGFFMLPRLLSGAHWLSDDVVGGGAIAALGLAAGICTPMLNRPLKVISKPLNRAWEHYVLPLLQSVGIFRS